MARRIPFITGALACGLVWFAAAQSNPIKGQWTVGGPVVQDQIQLTIRRSGATSSMSNSSRVALKQLQGLTREHLDSAGSVARFELVRDAGTMRFEGYLQSGGGGGTFTFVPSPTFAPEMRSLGFSDLSDERVFAMAVHDVSTAYVRDMNALGVRPESVDKLITMRIHGVTTDFVKEVAALGYNHPPADQLVTMRIHGVTPEFIRKTRSLGLGSLSIDQMVSLKIHGVVD